MHWRLREVYTSVSQSREERGSEDRRERKGGEGGTGTKNRNLGIGRGLLVGNVDDALTKVTPPSCIDRPRIRWYICSDG